MKFRMSTDVLSVSCTLCGDATHMGERHTIQRRQRIARAHDEGNGWEIVANTGSAVPVVMTAQNITPVIKDKSIPAHTRQASGNGGRGIVLDMDVSTVLSVGGWVV